MQAAIAVASVGTVSISVEVEVGTVITAQGSIIAIRAEFHNNFSIMLYYSIFSICSQAAMTILGGNTLVLYFSSYLAWQFPKFHVGNWSHLVVNGSTDIAQCLGGCSFGVCIF